MEVADETSSWRRVKPLDLSVMQRSCESQWRAMEILTFSWNIFGTTIHGFAPPTNEQGPGDQGYACGTVASDRLPD